MSRSISSLLFYVLVSFLVSLQSGAQSTSETVDQDMAKYSQVMHGLEDKEFLTEAEAKEIFKAAYSHPVARLDRLGEYDPTGLIGFCFGRAMAVQLLARSKYGLSAASIQKLFVSGDMRSNPQVPEWRFHVTTLAKVKREKTGIVEWMAIDPIMSGPLTTDEWIQRVQSGWDRWHGEKPKSRFYIVDADAVLPDIRSPAEPERGNQLIELNFVPEEQGIKARSRPAQGLGGIEVPVYEVDSAQAEKYFLVARPDLPTTFSFQNIAVGEQVFPYNKYFSDLLASISPYVRNVVIGRSRSMENMERRIEFTPPVLSPRSGGMCPGAYGKSSAMTGLGVPQLTGGRR